MRSIWTFCALAAIAAGALGQEPYLGRTADQWEAALTSGDAGQRLHAAWAIAQMAGRSTGIPDDQERFANVVKLVNDSDPSVRYWGVMGLANYAARLNKGDGGQTAVINTLEPLLKDESPAPRIAAALALGQLGRVEQALGVLTAAMSHPQESVRIQAVAALEKLGSAAQPAEAILSAATSDSSEYVKRISERALGNLAPEKKSGETPAPRRKKKK
jgi:HEAT repeat protein